MKQKISLGDICLDFSNTDLEIRHGEKYEMYSMTPAKSLLYHAVLCPDSVTAKACYWSDVLARTVLWA